MKKIVSAPSTAQERRAKLDEFATRPNLSYFWDEIREAVEAFKAELGYPDPVDKSSVYGKQHSPAKSRELVNVLTHSMYVEPSSGTGDYAVLVFNKMQPESKSLQRSRRKQDLMQEIRLLVIGELFYNKDQIKKLLGTIAWRVTGNRQELNTSLFQIITGEKGRNPAPGNKEFLFGYIVNSIASHGKTACDAIAELLEEGTGNKTELIAMYVKAFRYDLERTQGRI